MIVTGHMAPELHETRFSKNKLKTIFKRFKKIKTKVLDINHSQIYWYAKI
jgi:hypothetical protein